MSVKSPLLIHKIPPFREDEKYVITVLNLGPIFFHFYDPFSFHILFYSVLVLSVYLICFNALITLFYLAICLYSGGTIHRFQFYSFLPTLAFTTLVNKFQMQIRYR